MKQSYLPSAQFTLIVGALLVALGLVYVAQRLTAPPSLGIITQTTTPSNTDNWQADLYAVQGQNASTSIPQPVNPAAVAQALKEAQTSNLTDSVGRTLLIDLTNAKSQGLGDDTPTQQAILADATSQISHNPSIVYTSSDLHIVSDSATTRRAYGNQVMLIFLEHSSASSVQIMAAIAQATDNNDPSPLQTLPGIQKQYKAIVQNLLTTPVPQTLSPLHLLMVNDLENMTETISGMEVVLNDPVRGSVSVQQFNSLLSEENRVFTNIAQALQKDGILFNKNEPGSTWSVFLSPTS